MKGYFKVTRFHKFLLIFLFCLVRIHPLGEKPEGVWLQGVVVDCAPAPQWSVAPPAQVEPRPVPGNPWPAVLTGPPGKYLVCLQAPQAGMCLWIERRWSEERRGR